MGHSVSEDILILVLTGLQTGILLAIADHFFQLSGWPALIVCLIVAVGLTILEVGVALHWRKPKS